MTRKKLAESDEEIMAILAEGEEIRRRLERDYDELMEKYPNKWVAVSKDGLVAHHDEVKNLIALYEAAGYNGNQVDIEYMDPNPLPMVPGSLGASAWVDGL